MNPMMLVTDNRELVEAAQLPRVNLSTTNKTTREINLNNLMMGGACDGTQQRGNAGGNTGGNGTNNGASQQATKQLK